MRKEIVNAHCDGPCGVYDPASARIAAEAVVSMTKKMLDLKAPISDSDAMAHYTNTMSRYASIKEEEAQKCKDEILVLWTDFLSQNIFRPIVTFTHYFGVLQNFVVHVKLSFH